MCEQYVREDGIGGGFASCCYVEREGGREGHSLEEAKIVGEGGGGKRETKGGRGRNFSILTQLAGKPPPLGFQLRSEPLKCNDGWLVGWFISFSKVKVGLKIKVVF